jgi:hypothetical protein
MKFWLKIVPKEPEPSCKGCYYVYRKCPEECNIAGHGYYGYRYFFKLLVKLDNYLSN